MAKATSLTPDALEIPESSPTAAAAPRKPIETPPAREAKLVKALPLQLRLPRQEIRAIKIAAAEQEQTISEFMLACFHAHMQTRKN